MLECIANKHVENYIIVPPPVSRSLRYQTGVLDLLESICIHRWSNPSALTFKLCSSKFSIHGHFPLKSIVGPFRSRHAERLSISSSPAYGMINHNVCELLTRTPSTRYSYLRGLAVSNLCRACLVRQALYSWFH